MKHIKKIGVGKYVVTTPDVRDSEIKLDFNPLIEQFNLSGNFYLIHWQARPQGYRQWGIYNSKDDTYTSSLELPKAYGAMRLLMLDDSQPNKLPSAVIHFVGIMKLS